MRSRRRRSRLYRIFRYAYLKCIRQNHTPERIGRGMALGVFIGIFPTLWFGPVLSLAAAGLMGANRAAAVVGNFICGPLTPFTWTLSVFVGNLLVREEWRIARELLEQDRRVIMERFLATFLLGNVTVSFAFALAGYALVWWLARRYRARRLALSAERAVEESS
jgi:uncharacterized protein (DUF2062 family)